MDPHTIEAVPGRAGHALLGGGIQRLPAAALVVDALRRRIVQLEGAICPAAPLRQQPLHGAVAHRLLERGERTALLAALGLL